MSNADVVKRIEALETARQRADLAPMLDRLSAATGVPADDLWNEAEQIAADCHRNGITSRGGMLEYVAAQTGIPVAELQADTDYYRDLAA